MCGLCGIIWDKPGTMPARLGYDVLRKLVPRGPDDQGVLYYTRNEVILAGEPEDVESVEAVLLHRRLSILDLSKAGWQPMESKDGRYYIILNGEVYNYLELRSELQEKGYGPFHSGTDTEVLLEGYRLWGSAVLNRLIGMFAFAVLDRIERKIFLARDFFGIKPLYYAVWQQGVAFASEIKALLQLPGVSRQVNAKRAYDYLQHNVTDFGDETMFAAIRQVPAGHYMVLDLDRTALPDPVRYWQISPMSRTDLSFEEAASHLRDLFLRSIELHMRSDVPVGSALSGGIDSSGIVCGIRALYPESEIHSFSYIAEDPALSEEQWIDRVAEHAGVTVHKVWPESQDLVNDLDDLIRIQEEPVGGTSVYAQYRVFSKAQQAGIKVMLDGQGADEQFGGYKLFLAARLATLLRTGQWQRAVRYAAALNRQPMSGGTVQQIAYALGIILPDRLTALLMPFKGRQATPSWLNVSWFDEQGIQRVPHRWGATTDHVLKEMLERTLTETSLPMLLRYEDRNSMAFSIESRVPYLSPPLAEFIFSLPEEYVIDRDGTTKAVLRRALRGIVPDIILDRKDKIGFVTPEQRWLTRLRPWVDGILSSETARQLPLLKADVVQKQWKMILEKGKPIDFRVVWRWVNLIRWAEHQQISF